MEDFFIEFENGVRMERLLNKSPMSSELKASVLETFLEDQAAHVYHELAGKRDVSYEELTAHLKMEFGCRLSQYDPGKRLDANKRAGDTWKDHITYLKFIERLIEGDRSQLLLETVCNNACPELRSTLLSKVDESSTNCMDELDKVVNFLIRLQGDGRRTGHNKQGAKGGQPRQQQSKAGGSNGQQGKQGAQQRQAALARRPRRSRAVNINRLTRSKPRMVKRTSLPESSAAEYAERRDTRQTAA